MPWEQTQTRSEEELWWEAQEVMEEAAASGIALQDEYDILRALQEQDMDKIARAVGVKRD